MGISTAVSSADVSRTSGYQLNKGNFNVNAPNLPQQIVILAEANDANQGTIVTTPVQITSAAQAGQIYGYGSPIHHISRILFPQRSTGVGAIPVFVMAQLAPGGATAQVFTIAITGTSTANMSHAAIINGRASVDLAPYNVNIVIGDTPDLIATKYYNAINAVLGAPVIATKTTTTGTATASTVVFSATALTAGQSVGVAALIYTSTAGTTQAQLAAAFASLSAGATTGPGTSTGTYSGALTGFNSGAVTSGTTVIFTSTTVGINSPVTTNIGGGATAPAVTSVAGTAPTGSLILTSKWLGLTAASLNIGFDVSAGLSGISYAVTNSAAGSGAPSIATAISQFQSNWYTTVINSYGTNQLATLEAFNGIPSNTAPTGQYEPQIFMPLMAFFGSTDPVAANLVTITDAMARVSQVTNVLCPAPASLGFPWEAAANMVTVFCPIAQSKPYLTAAGQAYPDMPIPSTGLIGDMSNYTNRNLLKSKGCSTVMLVNGAYQIQDLITTYHPTGEVPLIFNECRYLNIDWNIYYGYNLLQIANVNDKVLVADGLVTDVDGSDVISPAAWKAILFTFFDALEKSCLITNAAFSKTSLVVEIDSQNPNRFNVTFSYQRTGTAEIESTTVTVGF